MIFTHMNDIKLHAGVLEELYKNDLVDLRVPPAGNEQKPAAKLSFLGGNQKRVVVLVDEPDTLYLPDSQLNFLLGILTACKLTMADIALVNLAKNPPLGYESLGKDPGADKVLLFGCSPSALNLPLQFPHYQVQHYNSQVYLSSPELAVIEANRDEKTKLWAALKQLFSIGQAANT
jgi:hypothetical protein